MSLIATNNTGSNMKAAQTILAQLGGNRFVAMIGAKNFVGDDKMVQFSIGRGAVNKANKVRIDLEANDTYTVRFYNIRGVNVKEISAHGMVYADNLRDLFTQQTGMDTSL